jgi:hypothetical protein
VGVQERNLVRGAVVAAVVFALAVATACSSSGSGSGAAPPGTAGTTAPTDRGSAPATAPPGSSPAASVVAAANLTASDLGDGWAVYPEEAAVLGEEQAGTCARAADVLADLADEETADGPLLQYGDRLVFAQSVAWELPDAASAEALAAHLLSDEHIECRRAELEAGLADVDPPLTVALTGSNQGDGSTAYVGSFFYETQQLVDGVAQPAGAASRHAVYVEGDTVIDLFTQVGVSADDPPDLADTTGAMIDAGMEQALARAAG